MTEPKSPHQKFKQRQHLTSDDAREKAVQKRHAKNYRTARENLTDLIDAAREGNPSVTSFDASCFDGNYITGDIDDDYLAKLGSVRNDASKTGVSGNKTAHYIPDLHNND